MNNDLQLLSGIDIPFIEARLIIHQPTLKEIAYIGEESFFIGCELLHFSKDNFLKEEDKVNLENKTNFDVLMSILKDKSPSARKHRIQAMMVLSLMFPDYKILVMKDHIGFFKEGEEERVINNKNYETFKEILSDMFCLKKMTKQDFSYNPGDDRAREIAERFKKGREKAAAAKGESQEQKVSILSRYVSILTIGQHKNLNSLLDYTIYQLFDEFNRFELKQNYDIYIKAKMAGAQDLDEVDNWMKDIHS